MSSGREHKKGLDRISDCFKKLEKFAALANLDLDILAGEFTFYGKAGFSSETTFSNASRRKSIFENETKEKSSQQYIK
jgi:hypothetical protein